MRAWEYCYLEAVGRMTLAILSANGQKRFRIRQQRDKGDRDAWDAYCRSVAELGLDGWEMITNQRLKPGSVAWFKRPVSEIE